MAKNQVWKVLKSLIIGKCKLQSQGDTTTYLLDRKPKVKTTDKTIGETVEQLELTYVVGGKVKR